MSYPQIQVLLKIHLLKISEIFMSVKVNDFPGPSDPLNSGICKMDILSFTLNKILDWL